MQAYQYRELQDPQEFRLLILSPGSRSDTIRCQLKHVLLSSNPVFEALSYVWGDTSKPREILCQDKSIAVTESLFTALRYLRHEDQERTIWADAVCIDQGFDHEKNHQLALMRKIYSGAAQTLVWLGEDKNYCAEKAFNYFSKLYECLVEENRFKWQTRDCISSEYQVHGIALRDWFIEFIDVVAPIFDMPWFYRLWVVQEVVMAKQAMLIFGTKSIPMDHFIGVIERMNNIEEMSYYQERYNFHALCNVIDMEIIRKRIKRTTYRVDNQMPEVLELLRETERLLHTDPRDRIYAILGLATDPGFSADYTLSTEETFTSFASLALGAFPGLVLLSYSRGVSSSKWMLPSWAPSPDMGGLPVSLLWVDHFRASGEISGRKEVEEARYNWYIGPGNDLHLRGRVIDFVKKTGARWVNAARLEEKRYSLLEAAWVAECGSATFEDERYKRFCAAMTLQLNTTKGRAPRAQTEWFHHYFQRITKQRLPKVPDEQGGDPNHEVLETNDNAIATIHTIWPRYRYFCLTGEDRFAWVAHRTEQYDKICVIRGARIPYVLRPQLNGKYMLVGECWIQGLMEGEALDLPGFEWEDICLI
jgi:hypothetical protein